MKPRLLWLTPPLAACLLGLVANAQTSEGAASATSKTEVALMNLRPPVYPPLARQARIMGDVKIQVHIRRDGSVDSAEVLSGPAMLRQAALESAQKSTFWCQGCADAMTFFTLTYTFGSRDDLDGVDCSITRSRAKKCLYLWACGLWHGRDPRTPAVGHSSDHVMILADPTCIDTMTGS